MDIGGSAKNTKTIQITDDVFTVSSKKKTLGKSTRKKKRPIIDTAQLQAQLLNNIKIRNQQIIKPDIPIVSEIQSSKIEPSINEIKIPELPSKPLSEYEDSLNFMKMLTQKEIKPSKPVKHKENKHVSSNVSKDILPTSNAPYKIDSDVPHGCLKNGLKKTYKNITHKIGGTNTHVSFNIDDISTSTTSLDNNTKPTTSHVIINDIIPPALSDTYIQPINLSDEPSSNEVPKSGTTKTIQLDEPVSNEPIKNLTDNIIPSTIKNKPTVTMIRSMTSRKNKCIKTLSKTFRLGKHPSKKIISIFCKNAEMITGIKQAHSTIKNTRLDDMKRYLVKKSLLSIGSPAPSDVIKQMYMSAITAGDIINHNDDVLLKNYMDVV